MTDDELQAIRERLAKITPGPWVEGHSLSLTDDADNADWVDTAEDILFPKVVCVMRSEQGFDDAEFIAHAPEDIAALLDEVEELREKLHIARASADSAQVKADSALAQLKKFETISVDNLKADIDYRIVAAQVLNHHDVTPPNSNLGTADMISPCRESEQVLSRSEAENLKAENASLRELLGLIDGHAGEIVSALAVQERQEN